MFQSVYIHNFRGIKNIHITGLKEINVFGRLSL